jgi:CHAT domain-containing protein
MGGFEADRDESAEDKEENIDRGAGSLTRDAISTLRRLPGTRSEVEAIAGIAPDATVLLGPEASEENLYRMATKSDSLELFSVIHIASHAIINDKDPERSCLVLSQCGLSEQLEDVVKGERRFDGLVSTREMIDEWDLGAELVTLSACQTGLGRNIGGEGYIGFSNALLQAGARSLVVSLWKVEDIATSMLMKRFYENYFGQYDEKRNGNHKEPMGKAEALREAKIWLRSYTDDSGETPYEHPFYWSAFILIGNRERH